TRAGPGCPCTHQGSVARAGSAAATRLRARVAAAFPGRPAPASPTRPGLARARAPAHAGTTRAHEGITNVCRCARPVTGTARRSFDVDDAAGIRAEGAAAPDRGGDEGLVPRLLDERDRAARAPGCSGRAEARTPP